jgi:hypothetical protein
MDSGEKGLEPESYREEPEKDDEAYEYDCGPDDNGRHFCYGL